MQIWEEKMKNIACESFFLIKSAGRLDYLRGYLPEEGSTFSPNLITEQLGIVPFHTIAAGEVRPHGKSIYNFSAWYGCRQRKPEVGRIDQASRIVEELWPCITELKKIKEQYRVFFSIELYPRTPNEDGVIGFSYDVVEFCYLTGTEIVVDMFGYSEKGTNLSHISAEGKPDRE